MYNKHLRAVNDMCPIHYFTLQTAVKYIFVKNGIQCKIDPCLTLAKSQVKRQQFFLQKFLHSDWKRACQ